MLGAYKVKGSGGMPQYEAVSDGKCFNIRQGVRGYPTFGSLYLLAIFPSSFEITCHAFVSYGNFVLSI